jgi:hypothetical protein
MSDDQLAIIGCGLALLVGMVLLSLSAQVGKIVRRDEAESLPEAARLAPQQQRRKAA